MKNKILAVCFALPFCILVGWTLLLSWQQQHGQEITVAVTGYDPRDLLSGHYIQYQIDWDHTDCSQFATHMCAPQDFCQEKRWGRQCRFYIPERHARALDNLFRQRNNEDMKFEIVYSYTPGRQAMAKRLLINGRDWWESLP